MKRTQLYLDDDLWNVLHAHARTEKTSISDLVRQAARARYIGKFDERRDAMQAFVGIRKDRSELVSAVDQVRSLRRGKRLGRLKKK
ncbi:MAG TPA: CopG family transcriptional regulator [Candidatus Angelobacter sp.]|nr:CopG family transcriptional regulator [Candidatus Angelobacter sp.]